MTRLVLDKVRVFGAIRVGVIAEIAVDLAARPLSVTGHGSKSPRFVLVEDEAGLRAFHQSGAPLAVADIEAECADLLEEFRRQGGSPVDP